VTIQRISGRSVGAFLGADTGSRSVLFGNRVVDAGDAVVAPEHIRVVPPYPSFPDAESTGPTVDHLTPYTGPTNFTVNNQVIQGVEIRTPNQIVVFGDHVTFRDVKFVYTGTFEGTWTLINVDPGSNFLFEDCEIDCQNLIARAIWGDGDFLTVKRCEIHNTGNAIEYTGGHLWVEDCYIHQIWEPPGNSDWHADGIQTWMGQDNITIKHNVIAMAHPATSSCGVGGTAADVNNEVLVTENLISGGGYSVGPMYGGTNCKFINNHLSTVLFPKVGEFNIYYDRGAMGATEISGNVIHETGASADFNFP